MIWQAFDALFSSSASCNRESLLRVLCGSAVISSSWLDFGFGEAPANAWPAAPGRAETFDCAMDTRSAR